MGSTENVRQLVYRPATLAELLGCSVTTLYRRVESGDLPPPIRLGGGRAVGWLASEIDAWLEARAAERGEGPGDTPEAR